MVVLYRKRRQTDCLQYLMCNETVGTSVPQLLKVPLFQLLLENHMLTENLLIYLHFERCNSPRSEFRGSWDHCRVLPSCVTRGLLHTHKRKSGLREGWTEGGEARSVVCSGVFRGTTVGSWARPDRKFRRDFRDLDSLFSKQNGTIIERNCL